MYGFSLSCYVHSLASYDLVITTYNIVGIEGESCQDEDTVNQDDMICCIPVEWLLFMLLEHLFNV